MGGPTRRPADRPIVRFNPCDCGCEQSTFEGETGAALCRIYGIDFAECPAVRKTDQLEEVALEIASWIARHLTGLERDEAAGNAAVLLSDWFTGSHATLDDEAFLARCSVRVGEEVTA